MKLRSLFAGLALVAGFYYVAGWPTLPRDARGTAPRIQVPGFWSGVIENGFQESEPFGQGHPLYPVCSTVLDGPLW